MKQKKGPGRPRLVNRPVMLSIRIERETQKVLARMCRERGISKIGRLCREILTAAAMGENSTCE